MKRGIILGLFLMMIFVLPMVAATDTVVNLRSFDDQRAHIYFLKDSDKFEVLDVKHTDLDESGQAQVTYSGPENTIDIRVQIDVNGEKFAVEDFQDFSTGQRLYLQVLPGNTSDNYLDDSTLAEVEDAPKKETVEESEVESEEMIEEETGEEKAVQNKGISGFAISNLSVPKNTYYIIGGVLVLLVAGFLVMKTGMLSKMSSGNKESHTLEEAERKLREAQEEIKRLKDGDEISKAEKQLEKDKKKLENLRRNLNDDSDRLKEWEDKN